MNTISKNNCNEVHDFLQIYLDDLVDDFFTMLSPKVVSETQLLEALASYDMAYVYCKFQFYLNDLELEPFISDAAAAILDKKFSKAVLKTFKNIR